MASAQNFVVLLKFGNPFLPTSLNNNVVKFVVKFVDVSLCKQEIHCLEKYGSAKMFSSVENEYRFLLYGIHGLKSYKVPCLMRTVLLPRKPMALHVSSPVIISLRSACWFIAERSQIAVMDQR